MNSLITIITPTYNRKNLIQLAYQSLIEQEKYNFKWFVIDDGSVDDTETYISSIQKEAPFDIQYTRKKNGGKHRALNFGIPQITTELTLILDSDDQLTKDATKIIEDAWESFRDKNNIAYMSFLRGYSNGDVIGDLYKCDYYISNHIKYCVNENVRGDKAEVFRTSVLKEYPFPEVPSEKFISEGVVWNRIGKKYDAVYINKIIYITEYLPGGLTQSGMKMRLKNPIGGMLFANECITKEYVRSKRIKYSILYDLYFLSAKNSPLRNDIICNNTVLSKLCMPIALAYYIYVKGKTND
jgi:glycosyltransferase involved in cell wall biosynthesis